MWKRWFGKTNEDVTKLEAYKSIDFDKLPKHIAIIMDGNGRWAQKQGLMRTLGHRAGVETLREVVKAASGLGIQALTAYAFSTENWKRPDSEVKFLMDLFSEYLDREIDELHENNVKIRFIGIIEELSNLLQTKIESAQLRTANNTGLILNLAVNYGSRDEITRTVKIIANKVKNNEIKIEEINENFITNHLDTAGIPEVDLVIRPSGDLRISNFLLWQMAYAEFWFTEINWPDFKPNDLLQAVLSYQKRERRFGGLK